MTTSRSWWEEEVVDEAGSADPGGNRQERAAGGICDRQEGIRIDDLGVVQADQRSRWLFRGRPEVEDGGHLRPGLRKEGEHGGAEGLGGGFTAAGEVFRGAKGAREDQCAG